MQRILRLLSLIIIGLIAGGLMVFFAQLYIPLVIDDAAKATIAGAIIAAMATIFTALYNEIVSYYKDRSIGIGKKWDLIYPFIKDFYHPWINSSRSFYGALERVTPKNPSDACVLHILYLTLIFYGYRLSFIIKGGGLILLSTTAEEKAVMDAYRNVQKNFQFAADETSMRVSYLQDIFLTKSKPDNPYVQANLVNDLYMDRELQVIKKELKEWLSNPENVDNLKKAMQCFTVCFKESLDKLYTAWSD